MKGNSVVPQLAILSSFLLLLSVWSHAGEKQPLNLEYVSGGHELQKLDLYLPEAFQQPPALIVFVHGGGWRAGNKDKPQALPFLKQGYAVASINYRLSQHAIFPAQIQDCKAAIRWLRAKAKTYGYDPNRIGVWGPSAGGHLVALLGTTDGISEFDVGENLELYRPESLGHTGSHKATGKN
jgi:acetyl esterase/lipase